tara:strand:+ start:3416 stop:3532 length:117 start_codon:yes stop_codon:yes gene_type:complete
MMGGTIGTQAKNVGGNMSIEQFLLIIILVIQIVSYRLK